MRSSNSKGLAFVATLNAETLETLAESYMSLAKHLGITEYTLTSLTTSKIDTAAPTKKSSFFSVVGMVLGNSSRNG